MSSFRSVFRSRVSRVHGVAMGTIGPWSNGPWSWSMVHGPWSLLVQITDSTSPPATVQPRSRKETRNNLLRFCDDVVFISVFPSQFPAFFGVSRRFEKKGSAGLFCRCTIVTSSKEGTQGLNDAFCHFVDFLAAVAR